MYDGVLMSGVFVCVSPEGDAAGDVPRVCHSHQKQTPT